MSEENTTPEETGQVDADVQEEVQPVDEETQEAPPERTPEQIEQSFKSWLGRRDKELLGTIRGLIDEKVRALAPAKQPEPEDATTVFDDPNKWLDKRLEQKVQATEQYNASLITVAGEIMDNDPLFEDQELGAEVVGEIRANISKFIDPRIDPKIQAERMVDKALKTVIRKSKMNGGTKQNPLAGNTPGKVGSGIPAPKTAKIKAKAPKLDDYTKQFAAKWGYGDEELAELFSE